LYIISSGTHIVNNFFNFFSIFFVFYIAIAFITIYMYSSIVIVLYLVRHFYNSYVVYGTKIKRHFILSAYIKNKMSFLL